MAYNLLPKIREVKRIIGIVLRKPHKIIKAVDILVKEGPKSVIRRSKRQDVLHHYSEYINQEYQIWYKKNFPSQKKLLQQKKIIVKFKYQPKISIIMPTFNTPIKFLKESIRSVLAQTYPNWELCIADDASTNNEVRQVLSEFAQKDQRIKFIFRRKNGHICEASNSALGVANGDFVGLLDHDDIIWPDALFEITNTINENNSVEFIYSDEDKLSEDGRTHIDPFFKPDWSPDYIRSANYITHFAVIKRSLIEKVGGFRKGTEGAQDWDLFLRIVTELTRYKNYEDKIIHIPKVLYSWRKSNLSSSSQKGAESVKKYAFNNQKRVLGDDLKRRGLKGRVLPTKYLGIWRVKYLLHTKALVSIVIPTKDKYEYITRCVYSIIKKSSYKNYEIVLIDTGSADKGVWGFYETVLKENKKIKLIIWDKKFNFSAVCNFGAERSRGDYLIFLNNDTEVITPDWIENMLEHAQRDEVGAVGVKLLFGYGRIQHSGVVLGIKGPDQKKGVAAHPFKNFFNSEDNDGYAIVVDAVRNWSAVTAACIMVSKNKFKLVGGFDEKLRIAFNDVDFCLRLSQKGFYNIYTPYAVLTHFESVSVGRPGVGDRDLKEFLREALMMRMRWENILENDPFYNKNLTLNNEEWRLKL